MEPDQQDVIRAEGIAQDGEIEVVGRVGVRDAVAAERRGVEDDPPPVGQAVAATDGLADALQPFLAEEDVGPRHAQARHEPIEGLAKSFGVVRRGGLTRRPGRRRSWNGWRPCP